MKLMDATAQRDRHNRGSFGRDRALVAHPCLGPCIISAAPCRLDPSIIMAGIGCIGMTRR